MALALSGNCDCVIAMFRAFANDMVAPYTYSDARITQLINAAAFIVSTELEACTAVTTPSVNFCTYDTCSILPNYPSFTSLVVLKAMCMLDQSMVRDRYGWEGIKAACGPAALSVVSSPGSTLNMLMEYGPCVAYKQLKEDLCFRAPMQAAAYCYQIVGPFTSENWEPGSGGVGGGYIK